jgi:hypothetical protein
LLSYWQAQIAGISEFYKAGKIPTAPNGLRMDRLASSVSQEHTITLSRTCAFEWTITAKHGAHKTANVSSALTVMVTRGKMEMRSTENAHTTTGLKMKLAIKL